MTIHTFAADLSDRIPEMARDGKLNNQKLIEQMLTEFFAQDDGIKSLHNHIGKLSIIRFRALLLVSEIEGVVAGLKHHPYDIPLNGCLISKESQSRIAHINTIIDSFKECDPDLYKTKHEQPTHQY